MKKITFALLTSLLVISACSQPVEVEENVITETEEQPEQDLMLQNRIVLTNVSADPAEGSGFYGTMEDETRLFASFDVVDPGEDFFYEGWLVCEGKPYTTNALTLNEGKYENIFVSTEVPTNCQKYVLTIEPDDGDPAPAAHVLEGVLEKK